ncbi:MAG: hypothetical protein GX038_05550 [Erysipelothrix sp.]|nr:hypothetical protein [Erysipelothrix sp.]
MDSDVSVFILCEGVSEVAIINILLDSDNLIYKREDLEYYEPLHIREAKQFEVKYLNVEYEYIKVYRILDSKNKDNLNFSLSDVYNDKVEIINCVTSPEIEILYIISEGHYDKYKLGKSNIKKAKDYVKQILKISNPNSSKTINHYFKDAQVLVDAILEYDRLTKKNSKFETLAVLIIQGRE